MAGVGDFLLAVLIIFLIFFVFGLLCLLAEMFFPDICLSNWWLFHYKRRNRLDRELRGVQWKDFKGFSGYQKGDFSLETVIVAFHGRNSDALDMLKFFGKSEKHCIFSVEYDGYGERSDLSASEEKCIETACVALASIVSIKSKNKVIAVGHSMGTSILLQALARLKNERPSRIVLASQSFVLIFLIFISFSGSFLSFKQATKSKLGMLTYLIANHLDSFHAIRQLEKDRTIAFKIIHGTKDTLIDVECGRRVAELLHADFIEQDCDHNDVIIDNLCYTWN